MIDADREFRRREFLGALVESGCAVGAMAILAAVIWVLVKLFWS